MRQYMSVVAIRAIARQLQSDQHIAYYTPSITQTRTNGAVFIEQAEVHRRAENAVNLYDSEASLCRTKNRSFLNE